MSTSVAPLAPVVGRSASRATAVEHGRVSLRERVSYALGDTASNFYWKAFEVFIAFYYTDVFGLTATELATMLFVTRFLDAALDPLVGIIADRTATRWGKFRPFILWCSAPLGIAGVFAFSRPELPHSALVAYAYATYAAMMLAYSAVNIPYCALLGVITPDSQERTRISAYRFVGAFAGGMGVQAATFALVARLGNGAPVAGWQRAMMVYAVVTCAMFVACFAGTRERVAPPAGQRSGLARDLRDVLATPSWRVLVGLGMLCVAGMWIRGGASAYYFKYFLKREELLPWFFGTATAASIVGAALSGRFARVFGKRRVYATSMCIGSLGTALTVFVGPSNVALAFGLNVVAQLAFGAQAPLIWAMFADTADAVEWRTGRRATGLVFSTAVFSMKLGGACGGWMLATLLGRFGYVPNAEQSLTSLTGIVLAMSLVPAFFGFLVAAGVRLYELDEPSVARIGGDLAQRRGAK